MVKGAIQQEDVTLINIYAPNRGAEYIKHILMDIRGESNSNTVAVGDFNTCINISGYCIDTTSSNQFR